MDKEITCGQVEECIYQASPFVKDVTLFDVYEGKQIADDKEIHGIYCIVHTKGRSIPG